MRHLLKPADLTLDETARLIELARNIMLEPQKYSETCKGKILAAIFFEPSTRTRLSFESAMYGLGGNVLGFSSAEGSSAVKGESLADTIRMVSNYADICVIRHPKEGAAFHASKFATVPVINAGDGGHQHPTQTLTDLLTIHIYKGGLDNLKIGLCGDLKFGRTVHSLLESRALHKGNEFYLISPAELRIPEYIRSEHLIKNNIPFHEVENLEEVISELDVLYMTRVQRERFFNEEDYIRLKDTYILDAKKLASARSDLSIMHPLPRVNEIALEVDSDPRAVYFEQVKYGRFIRMALLLKLLGRDELC